MALRCLAVQLLPLLLTLGGRILQVEASDNNYNEGVPKEFMHLQEAEQLISQAEWRPEDLRSGEEMLREWSSPEHSPVLSNKLQTAIRICEKDPVDTERSLPEIEGVNHEVILMLGSDETVKSSGEYLFQKESGTSRQRTLMQWNEKMHHFSLLRTRGANTVELMPQTKLLVVGHGSLRDGDVRLGGKTSRELADSLLSLSKEGAELDMSRKSKTLREVSLVSCVVGEGPEGGQFVEELLVNMREGGMEVGSISARTLTTHVLPDGTKRTLESDASELWSHQNPKHKNTFYLGDDNKIHESTDSSRKSHQWHEEQKELNPLVSEIPMPSNDPL
ncbi:hypothetical protein NDU88_011911 [Pleurodeles waltl]|uniref:Peptidase C80 domain-containing protein n=1 Tax=Pleurodeles waltl TaxID=8319 RepID=A0AAV7S884_PLEWA|nr:hypothetical protein NDU88_011911 [Pleurodeles waltl]